MGYRIVNGRAYAVGNFFNLESEAKLTNGNTGEVSFNDVLNNIKTENEGFILSKHACKRFNEISFSRDDMNVINNGKRSGVGFISQEGNAEFIISCRDIGDKVISVCIGNTTCYYFFSFL